MRVYTMAAFGDRFDPTIDLFMAAVAIGLLSRWLAPWRPSRSGRACARSRDCALAVVPSDGIVGWPWAEDVCDSDFRMVGTPRTLTWHGR